MRIGFLSTRLSGTDGVTLEVEKLAHVLRRMGHELFYCAGELGGYASQGLLVPLMHFNHPAIQALTSSAFDPAAGVPREQLLNQIESMAQEMRPPIEQFIRANRLDVLFLQNVLAIPMNIPLGVCLARIIEDLGVQTIAHHHDFYWERLRYQTSPVFDLLDTFFPADLPSIQHVTINSIAQKRLKARRGIDSLVIPNVHDFEKPAPGLDDYNRDFREHAGLREEEIFILQPTRVIQRKGIEMAIELVHRLDLPLAHLIITHSPSDEGLAYWRWLEREAQAMGVRMQLIDQVIGQERGMHNGQKVFSLWDAYPHADLVTYPSLYEGFGNALLETIYFKRLAIVNRYPVYNADIGPLGFQFIELDGFVSDRAVAETRRLLADPAAVQAMVEKNYQLALEHFSYQTLEQKLQTLLANFS